MPLLFQLHLRFFPFFISYALFFSLLLTFFLWRSQILSLYHFNVCWFSLVCFALFGHKLIYTCRYNSAESNGMLCAYLDSASVYARTHNFNLFFYFEHFRWQMRLFYDICRKLLYVCCVSSLFLLSCAPSMFECVCVCVPVSLVKIDVCDAHDNPRTIYRSKTDFSTGSMILQLKEYSYGLARTIVRTQTRSEQYQSQNCIAMDGSHSAFKLVSVMTKQQQPSTCPGRSLSLSRPLFGCRKKCKQNAYWSIVTLTDTQTCHRSWNI